MTLRPAVASPLRVVRNDGGGRDGHAGRTFASTAFHDAVGAAPRTTPA